MNFSTIEINKLDFEIENCKVYHYRNEDNFRINIFFLEANSDVINENWKRFSNMVAANYQTSEYMSNREFDKWNFYIIYISKDDVSKELKNKIENDKFSSRKIVEDLFDKEFNDKEANQLIVKHITNTDLEDILSQTQNKIQEEYKPVNTGLWKLVHKDISFGRDTELQKQIVEQIIRLNDEN
ncbi:ABC-three component system middle component 1 [Avrilella dinanensis]|uniref:Uncharacterized protein n=1 Tax=Avrilella dinanensis TaxID=2008672 RepID=A0A2M9R3W6_9FLAO|nr:ABC-three component system middle component 1 [Avrilella dinanensis]PJR03557.1 hypothetical protein CDL10_02765 [Avrilella dinanensis]